MYKCLYCGKEFEVLPSKYATGKFCSKECARRYSSNLNRKERNERIKNSIEKWVKINKSKGWNHKFKGKPLLDISGIPVKDINSKKYYENPKLCQTCGKIIDYENRNRKYCSIECRKVSWSKFAKENEKFLFAEKRSHYKHGWYKGIYCDSSYELAYVIYCLDHNIKIERNNKGYEYEYSKGVKRKYYPDFRVDGKLVEIKGWKDKTVENKIAAVDEELTVLYENQLKPVFDYIKVKYGKSLLNIEELYEGHTETKKCKINCKMDIKIREKISQKIKLWHSKERRRWVSKEGRNKSIKESELEYYLNNGWKNTMSIKKFSTDTSAG